MTDDGTELVCCQAGVVPSMTALIRSADDQISPHQAVMGVTLLRDLNVPAIQPPPTNREKKMEKKDMHAVIPHGADKLKNKKNIYIYLNQTQYTGNSYQICSRCVVVSSDILG